MFHGYRVRAYCDSDRENAIALFERGNAVFQKRAGKSEFADYIRRARCAEIDRLDTAFHERSGRFWIVEDNSKTVGMLGLEPNGRRSIELRRLYVDPACQTAGLGRCLLAFAERAALQMGATKLCLSTSHYQTRAVRLYRRNGYDLRADRRSFNPTRSLSKERGRLCGSKILSAAMIPALSTLTEKGISYV